MGIVVLAMSDSESPCVSLLSRETARLARTRAQGSGGAVSAPVAATDSHSDSVTSSDTYSETDGDSEQVSLFKRNRSGAGSYDDVLSKAPRTPEGNPKRASTRPLIFSPADPPFRSPRSMSPTSLVPSLEEEQTCEVSQKVLALEEFIVEPVARAEVGKEADPPSTAAASLKDAGPKEVLAPSSPLPAEEVVAPATTASVPPAAASLPPEPRPQLQICPDNLKLPLQWDQVLCYEDPVTGERKFDRKRCPIDLPHPDLEFCGYVLDDNRSEISAFFRRKGLHGVTGARLPRPAGGAKAPYFHRSHSSYG